MDLEISLERSRILRLRKNVGISNGCGEKQWLPSVVGSIDEASGSVAGHRSHERNLPDGDAKATRDVRQEWYGPSVPSLTIETRRSWHRSSKPMRQEYRQQPDQPVLVYLDTGRTLSGHLRGNLPRGFGPAREYCPGCSIWRAGRCADGNDPRQCDTVAHCQHRDLKSESHFDDESQKEVALGPIMPCSTSESTDNAVEYCRSLAGCSFSVTSPKCRNLKRLVESTLAAICLALNVCQIDCHQEKARRSMSIRFDKFTVKAQESDSEAQSKAMGLGNPEMDSIHLLAALLAERDGIVQPLLKRIGMNLGRSREWSTESSADFRIHLVVATWHYPALQKTLEAAHESLKG